MKNRLLQSDDITSVEAAADGVEDSVEKVSDMSVDQIADLTAAGMAADFAAAGKDPDSIAIDENALTKYAERIKNLSLIDNLHVAASADAATEALEQALQATARAIQDGTLDVLDSYYNVVLNGLPGFGKTSIVKQFCNRHNLNMVKIDAASLAKETIGGIPYPKKDKQGKWVQAPVASKIWQPLKKPNTILFLDEFNTGTSDIMGSLLSLINNHELPAHVEDENGNVISNTTRFDNILFSVVAMNPYDPELFPDNTELTGAMSSRFSLFADVNGDVRQYYTYLSSIYKGILSNYRLPQRALERYAGQKNIMQALLTNKSHKFAFSDYDESRQVKNRSVDDHKQYKPLNYRSFLLLLTQCDGTKADFIKWLHHSGFISQIITRIQAGLSTYTDKNTVGNQIFTKRAPVSHNVQIKAAQQVASLLAAFEQTL